MNHKLVAITGALLGACTPASHNPSVTPNIDAQVSGGDN